MSLSATSAGPREVVIIGASLAGLFAAAAADAAGARTMIIERDTLPETPLARKGVPQGRQPHVLLHRGLLAAEKLVPGIREDLLNHDAVLRHRHHRLARRVRLAAYLDTRVRDGLGDSAGAGAAGPREGTRSIARPAIGVTAMGDPTRGQPACSRSEMPIAHSTPFLGRASRLPRVKPC